MRCSVVYTSHEWLRCDHSLLQSILASLGGPDVTILGPGVAAGSARNTVQTSQKPGHMCQKHTQGSRVSLVLSRWGRVLSPSVPGLHVRSSTLPEPLLSHIFRSGNFEIY